MITWLDEALGIQNTVRRMVSRGRLGLERLVGLSSGLEQTRGLDKGTEEGSASSGSATDGLVAGGSAEDDWVPIDWSG